MMPVPIKPEHAMSDPRVIAETSPETPSMPSTQSLVSDADDTATALEDIEAQYLGHADLADDQKFEEKVVAVARSGDAVLKKFLEKKEAIAATSACDSGDGLEDLKHAAVNGVKTGTPLCQRLMRALSKEEKAEYDALGKGYQAKNAWRKKWCATKYEKLTKEKVQIDSWSVEDTSIGEYMSLSSIIDREGGRDCPQAVAAGRKYVLRCCIMAGRWISWNTMTDRYDYLYVMKGTREVFARCWQLRKCESATSGCEKMQPQAGSVATSSTDANQVLPIWETPEKVRDAPAVVPAATTVGILEPKVKQPKAAEPKAASAPGGDDPATKRLGKPVAKEDSPKKGNVKPQPNLPNAGKKVTKRNASSGSTTVSSASSGGSRGKRPKILTDFECTVAGANSTKISFLQVTGQAARIIRNIESMEEWSWGRTKEVLGRLQHLQRVVDSSLAKCGLICQSFLSGCTAEDLAREHGEETVKSALEESGSKINADIDALKGCLDKATSMHSIMTSSN